MNDFLTMKLLNDLEVLINDDIDQLIPKRENCAAQDKYSYRYIIKKLEVALGAVHKAQDKIKEMEGKN